MTVSKAEHEDDIYVRKLGNNRGLSPVVYLHGLGESGLCFTEVAQTLAESPRMGQRRQLIPDLPGYGKSRLAVFPNTLEGLADSIARWLVRRGEHRVVVVGHSMGAIVALMLAAQYPGLVAGVVDIEGNKTGEDCTISGLVGSQTLGEFLTGGFQEMTRRILMDEIPGKNCCGFDDAAYKRYVQSLQVCSPQAFYEHASQLKTLSFGGGLAARLGELDCAKFFVSGRPWGSGSRSRRMVKQEGIPMSEIHPAGHWPFIDQVEMSSWVLARILTYFSS